MTTEDHFDIDAMIDAVYKSRRRRYIFKEKNFPFKQNRSKTSDNDDFDINNLFEVAYEKEADDVKSSIQSKDGSMKSRRSLSSFKENNQQFRQRRSQTPDNVDFHVVNLFETAYKKEAYDVETRIQSKDDSLKSRLPRSSSKESHLQSRGNRIRTTEKDDIHISNLLETAYRKEADDVKSQTKDDSNTSIRSDSRSKETKGRESRQSRSRTPEKNDFYVENLLEAPCKNETDADSQSKDDSMIMKSKRSRSNSKEDNLPSKESSSEIPKKDDLHIDNLLECKKEADDIKTSIQTKDDSDKPRLSQKENHLQSKESRSTTPVKAEFDINSLLETVYENVINDVKSLIQSKDDSIKSSSSRSSSKENNLQSSKSRSRTPENDEFDIDALLEAAYENEIDDDKSLNQTKDYFLKLKQSDSRPKDQDSTETISQIPARKRRFMEEIKQQSRSRSLSTDKSERSRNPEESRKRYLPSRSMSPDGVREVIHYSSDELSMHSLPTEFGKKQTNQKASYEERDARTVFLMQLPRNISTRDMKEFFSTVGQVRNFRMVSDRNSRKSKGIGYVEFTDSSAVTRALTLSGQKLYGVPILVLPTMAEKNRLATKQAAIVKAKGAKGPLKLYVGSLDYNITESMLRAIFEPFGVLQSVEIQYDPETNQSRGYGFVHFADSAAAKRAMAQMDGFEVAGRPMKVNATYYDKLDGSSTILDDDREEKGGIEMNAQSRAYLMQKLAQTYSPDFDIPATPVVPAVLQTPLREIGKSTCLVLSNLFDPSKETDPEWDIDYRDDVLEEVTKLGMIVHIAVDKFSHEGNVYLKCLTSDVAAKVIKSFNGRWYAGRTIRAVPIPFPNYSAMFPVSANAVRPIKPGER